MLSGASLSQTQAAGLGVRGIGPTQSNLRAGTRSPRRVGVGLRDMLTEAQASEPAPSISSVYDPELAACGPFGEFCAALESDPTLEELSLRGCGLGAAAITQLARALCRNAGLCSLDLRGNAVGLRGLHALEEAVDRHAQLCELRLPPELAGSSAAERVQARLAANRRRVAAAGETQGKPASVSVSTSANVPHGISPTEHLRLLLAESAEETRAAEARESALHVQLGAHTRELVEMQREVRALKTAVQAEAAARSAERKLARDLAENFTSLLEHAAAQRNELLLALDAIQSPTPPKPASA